MAFPPAQPGSPSSPRNRPSTSPAKTATKTPCSPSTAQSSPGATTNTVLSHGDIDFLKTAEPILAFRRFDRDANLLCVFNLSPDPPPAQAHRPRRRAGTHLRQCQPRKRPADPGPQRLRLHHAGRRYGETGLGQGPKNKRPPGHPEGLFQAACGDYPLAALGPTGFSVTGSKNAMLELPSALVMKACTQPFQSLTLETL
jgi:hypothetical protein